MEELRLENRILIMSHIKQICSSNNLDYIDFLEDIYLIITSEKDEIKEYNLLIDVLKDKLKKETVYDTEEELFHVVSFELDSIYTEDVIENSNDEDLKDVNNFLRENYLEIFSDYYHKKGGISEDDYDECVLSVFNNYDLDEYVADILVGKFIEDEVIKKK